MRLSLLTLIIATFALAQPNPDTLAKHAIDAQTGTAWEKARYFSFSFDVDRNGTRAASFPQRWDRYTGDYRLATRARGDLVIDGNPLQLAKALDEKSRRLFGRSLKLRQLRAGGCNACEAELNVLGTVVFDLSRIGIQFVASPRDVEREQLRQPPVARSVSEHPAPRSAPASGSAPG